MPRGLAPGGWPVADHPSRFFIGTGTTRYAQGAGFEDRPGLAAEIDRMAGLFTETLGYRAVPRFGPNLRAGELKARLGQFLTDAARTDQDFLVFYYTGHAEFDGGDFVLPFPETTSDLARGGVWASELANWLFRGTVVQRFLVILDTCHASAGGGQLLKRAIERLDRLGGLATEPSVAILTAARPTEQALSGAFTQAFVTAVQHRASGGHEPQFLPLDSVVEMVGKHTPSWQHARLFLTGDGVTKFLPNPRYSQQLRGLDLRAQLDAEQRAARKAELEAHVLPRAQGLDSPAENLWLFTGRHAALHDLCAWIGGRDAGPAMVVTGDPGSGKSAVLARLTVLADKNLRRRVPRIDQLPSETKPPVGSIARFIHARGKTGEQVLAGLCEAAGVEADTPGSLLAALAEQADETRRLTVVIDALDEATDPDRLALETLYPLLARGAAQSQLRLLLGTRRHLLDKLGRGLNVLDLDDQKYADPASVRDYARRCLTGLVSTSPYTGAHPGLVDAVAAAVAQSAGRSFLVALITGRSLALRGELADPDDARWRAGLPRIAADAMGTDLDQRLGTEARKARELLLPLAYAEGIGLPWEDIWAPLASALSGRSYSNDDLDWLVAQAGYYVVEALDGERSAYRLYHEALAEHLWSGRDTAATHRRIARFFADRAPRLPGGSQPDWTQAHPYVRQHLAAHAVAAGELDDLLLDPGYLLVADRTRLLAALPAARGEDARAAAQAYQRAIHHLRGKAPAEHSAYLDLAARCYGATALSRRISWSGPPVAWRARWADWTPQHPHRTLTGHTDTVWAVAPTTLDERPVSVTASSDCTVRVWDLTTGQQLGKPLTGHTDKIYTVATTTLGDHPVAITGSRDNTVRVWDLATGRQIGKPLTGHVLTVQAVATATLGDQQVAVTGSADKTIRIWDLTTGRQIGRPLTGHTDTVVAVATATVGDRVVAVTGSADNTIRRWDLASGQQVGHPRTGHTATVWAVATTFLGDRPVAVTGSADSTVLVWDLITGQQVCRPLSGHAGPVLAVATAAIDERPVAVTGSADSTVRVWDLITGQQIGQPLRGPTHPVCAVATSVIDERPMVVTGCADDTVRLWEMAAGQYADQPFIGHTVGIRAVATAVLGDRPVAVTGSPDRTVRVWDLITGRQIGQLLTEQTDEVEAVATAILDGRPVAVTGSPDRTVRVWDLITGQQIGQPLTGHTRPVLAVATATLDGRPVAVTGSFDNTARVWDLATGQQIGQALTGHTGSVLAVATATLDGRPVAVTGGADNTVRVWDLATGRQRGQPLTKHTGWVGAVATAVVDGRLIVITGGADAILRTWDITTGQPFVEPRIGGEWGGSVISLHDGRAVVTGGADTRVWVRDVSDGRILRPPLTSHTSFVLAASTMTIDDQPVAVTGSADHTVRIWDLTTGQPRGQPLVGHTGQVLAVATAALGDRAVAVTGSADRTMRVWDLTTGEPVGRPVGRRLGPLWRRLAAAGRHLGPLWRHLAQRVGPPTRLLRRVTRLRWRRMVRLWRRLNRLGQRLVLYSDWVRALIVVTLAGRPIAVTGGDDGRIQLWDLATRRLVAKTLRSHDGLVRAIVMADLSDQPTLVSGDRSGTLCAWPLARLAKRPPLSRVPLWRRPLRPLAMARGAGPVTALAYHRARGVVAARGSTVDLQPFVPDSQDLIELDAQITSLALDGPDVLVATTLQGVVVFDLAPSILGAGPEQAG
jgi:WD40 repeat protein